jgi:autotransporter-associated beta strand protein
MYGAAAPLIIQTDGTSGPVTVDQSVNLPACSGTIFVASSLEGGGTYPWYNNQLSGSYSQSASFDVAVSFGLSPPGGGTPLSPAANLIWNNSGSSGDGITWDSISQNWNNGSGAAIYSDGSNVIFNDNNNDQYSVIINTQVSPASVTFNNSSGDYTVVGPGGIGGSGWLTKSGTSALLLNTVNSYSGGTTVTMGTLVVGVEGALPNGAVTVSGGTLQLAAGTGLAQITNLSMTGNGALDITNNTLFIDYGSGPDPIASIAAWIANGYNDMPGAPAIISSAIATADAASGLSYGIGYADSADPGNPANLPSGTIEIMYTLLGDANLDG